MILITKAVGDFLGTRGIADEAIRFNGYPILDQDDYSPDVAGGSSQYTPCKSQRLIVLKFWK